jgi:uncharacterized repeat protein (TIGR01451 family)
VFTPGRLQKAVIVTGIPSSVGLTWTLAFEGTRTVTATPRLASKCTGAELRATPTGGEPSEAPIGLTATPPGPEPSDPPGPTPPVLPRPSGVFAACVVHHGKTYDATFGYFNANVGDVDIAVGSHNKVSPGAPGQGQPATFHPGFVNAAFTVHGISVSGPVTWSLAYRGEQRSATATPSLPACGSAAVHPVADLALTKSASPRSAVLGLPVRFTITVHNSGSEVVPHARVVDSLPGSQLAVVSVKTTLGSCRTATRPTSRQVSCRAPSLAPGQSFTVRIATRGIGAGSATDHASIIGLPHDPTPADNTASATVDITQLPRGLG